MRSIDYTCKQKISNIRYLQLFQVIFSVSFLGMSMNIDLWLSCLTVSGMFWIFGPILMLLASIRTQVRIKVRGLRYP